MKPSRKSIHAITFSKNGTAYDSGLKQFLQSNNGKYKNSNQLDPNIKGSHPFVSADGSFIIYSGKVSNSYSKDLFIIFKKDDKTWTKPQNLGNKINKEKVTETSPYVTPDGKFLFFGRKYDFYWVKADFINILKEKAF